MAPPPARSSRRRPRSHSRPTRCASASINSSVPSASLERSLRQAAHSRRALIGTGHGVTAIDRQIDPGDLPGVIGAQEKYRTGDVGGIADTAERMIIGGNPVGLGAVAFGKTFDDRGPRPTRRDRVYPDP